MKTYTIDCSLLDDGRQLHQTLAETMEFPSWYGANLDALFDCLTSLTEHTQLTLANWDADRFGKGFARVLTDAAVESDQFTVIFA